MSRPLFYRTVSHIDYKVGEIPFLEYLDAEDSSNAVISDTVLASCLYLKKDCVITTCVLKTFGAHNFFRNRVRRLNYFAVGYEDRSVSICSVIDFSKSRIGPRNVTGYPKEGSREWSRAMCVVPPFWIAMIGAIV